MNVRVARDGQIIGEYTEAEFASLLRKQEILSRDYFMDDTMTSWRPIYEYRSQTPLPPTPTPESVRRSD